MRADRLLSLLLLLQARGQMTARELARELEVSERTVYRDVDALSATGVPIYGTPGAEGGYALLDSYRTRLTGLTTAEVRALFMLSIPAPLDDLGMSQELRSALQKLAAALPDARRSDRTWVRQRLYVDPNWWRHEVEPVPLLRTVQQAVWQDRWLVIRYRTPVVSEIERCVAPYGLVAKAGAWYLVCARREAAQVHLLDTLVDARLDEHTFSRPAGFDLVAFWTAWCVAAETQRTAYTALVRVSPSFVTELPRRFGQKIHAGIAQAGPPDPAGWIRLTLCFDSFEAARERLLGCGRGVEILAPGPLRRSVQDFARQIVALYAG